MEKKSMCWWYQWYSLQYIFALLFALSSVLFPILYQYGYLYSLLCIWFWSQICGRVQISFALPIFHHATNLWVQESLTISPLLTPSIKIKAIHQRLRSINLQTRRLELLFFQVTPQVLAFVFRISIIYMQIGFNTYLGVFLIFTIPVIYYLSFIGKKAATNYEKAEHACYQAKYDYLYHQLHYGQTRTPTLFPSQELLHKEKIKALIGIWVFLGFVLCLWSHNLEDSLQICLLLVSWMGISDQIWSIWQTYIEWQGTRVCEVEIKETYMDVNVRVYPNSILWIQGPNGSGKTTLLKQIARKHTKDVCIISSDMIPRFGKVKDYMSFKHAKLFGLCQAINQLPKAYETDVSILPSIWSRGMLQKLNLGYALQSSCHLFLLDEACSHIPQEEEILFYQLLLSPKRTIILTSHQLQASFLKHPFVKAVSLDNTAPIVERS